MKLQQLNKIFVMIGILLLTACDTHTNGGNGGGNVAQSSDGFVGTIVYSIAEVPDFSGDVLVGGNFSSYNGSQSVYLAQINNDRTFDRDLSFAPGVVYSVAPSNDGSGDVYIGGDFNPVIRVNSDGSKDFGFDYIEILGRGWTQSIVAANDGSGDVYVGGSFPLNGPELMRINSDGSLDTDFFHNFRSTVLTIAPAVDGSGDVYVGGSFCSDEWVEGAGAVGVNNMVRLNNDGSIDTGFDTRSDTLCFFGDVNSIVPAADGSGDVYVGGSFSNYNETLVDSLVRLNSDGSVDAGFDTLTDGFITGEAEIYSIAMAVDGSGDVYVGGKFTSYDGLTVKPVMRLNSDGTIDTGFNNIPEDCFDSGTGTIRTIALAIDGSGDVLAGGLFQLCNGLSRLLVRLNSDGSVD